MRAGLTEYGFFTSMARIERMQAEKYMQRAQELQAEGCIETAQKMIQQAHFLDQQAQENELRAAAWSPYAAPIYFQIPSKQETPKCEK
jgi:hypothetical protein